MDSLVTLQPAAGREFSENAGSEQRHADGEGADDPVQLHSAFEHEPVEQGQDENQNSCLGEKGGAAMSGDGDEVKERGWVLCRGDRSRRNE